MEPGRGLSQASHRSYRPRCIRYNEPHAGGPPAHPGRGRAGEGGGARARGRAARGGARGRGHARPSAGRHARCRGAPPTARRGRRPARAGAPRAPGAPDPARGDRAPPAPECRRDVPGAPAPVVIWNAEAETLGRAARARLQLARLRETIGWAVAHVAFHRERLGGAEGPRRPILGRAPVRPESHLRANYPISLFAVEPRAIAPIPPPPGAQGKPTNGGYTAAD